MPVTKSAIASTCEISEDLDRFNIEHLLVLPVPFRRQGNELWIESQAHHGLIRWLDDFESLALAAAVIPEDLATERKNTRWIKPDQIIIERVRLIPLPWAYRPDQFIKNIFSTILVLDSLIRESRYLQFAISGLWGDWSSVATEIAIKQNRAYSIHTDIVCHEHVLSSTSNLGTVQRLRVKIDSPIMKMWHKRLIGKCSLGLFHGMDTFETYSKWAPKSAGVATIHNIHDIQEHDSRSLNIEKEIKLAENESVAILYAGRVAPEKAPLDWVNVLKEVKKQGIDFSATWAGNGPLFDAVKQQITTSDLSQYITLPGFIENRADIAELLESVDMFVFTHITPESPRCLIESLQFGVPIIGYESAYARDLISKHGGGILVPRHDIEALAKVIINLGKNKHLISQLKVKALKDGERFSSRAVFLERSELIKQYLK